MAAGGVYRVLGAIVVLWLAAGLYSVDSDESALARVFGRSVGVDVLPGMHWNPPWPVGRVDIDRTTTNFIMPVGYRMQPRLDVPRISNLWLSGDTNEVVVRLLLQYRIRSLSDFLINTEAPRELVRRAGERALTTFMASESVDDILTSRRGAMADAVRRGVQNLLDLQQTGVEVVAVTVEEASPPGRGNVRAAFQDVQNARSDRERLIHESRADAARVLSQARGEGDRLVNRAAAARHSRIALAKGQTARFLALAAEYAKAPRVTEQRLYLETLERILPEVRTFVVEDPDGGKTNLRVIR